MRIKRVSASCGCLKGKAVPEVIEPGEEGKIKVLCDLKNKVGQHNLFVYVVTDDNELTKLDFKFFVPKVLEYEPSVMLW